MSVETVRNVLNIEALEPEDPARWPGEAVLRERLGNRYFPLSESVSELARRTVRASSIVENLNSRLRSYFFLRRHLTAGLPSLAPVLPQPPPFPAKRAARADRQEPGGATDRRGAWPLAGATRLHSLFTQLNAPSRRFLPLAPGGNAQRP